MERSHLYGRGRRRLSAPATVLLILVVTALLLPSAATPPIKLSPLTLRTALRFGEIVPSQPGFGWTKGDFSVSDDGAARYRLPLWVPDGRGRSAPKLSLSYDSRAGNGLLGIGWTLAGLASITWCPRTIAQDGYTDFAGRFDGSDALCLDGNRLVPVSPRQQPQTEYRTQRDPFARITGFGTSDGVPDYFTVEAKDGLTLTFGAGSARMYGYRLKPKPNPDNPGQPDFANPGLVPESLSTRVTTAWALSKIADRNGNTASMGYLDSPTEANHSTILPSWIKYAPNRRIQFVYNKPSQPRPDLIDGYGGGVYFRNVRRLIRIEMWGGSADGIAAKLREYRLAYQNGSVTARSLLTSIDECDPGGTCKLPLTMTYSLGSNNFQAMPAAELAGKTQSPGRVPFNVRTGDVDGDGRGDLIYQASKKTWVQRGTGVGTGFANPVQSTDVGQTSELGLRPADVDANGRTELMADTPVPFVGKKGHMWQIYESTGTGFARRPGSLVGPWRAEGAPSDGDDEGYLSDLDGNGLPDFVMLMNERNAGQRRWAYTKNSGVQPGGFGFSPFHPHKKATDRSGPAQAVDTDGDGRAELLQQRQWTDEKFGGYISWGLRPRPNQMGEVEFGTPNIKNTYQYIFFIDQAPADAIFGDLNGDGLDDAIIVERSSAGTNAIRWQLRAQVNSGHGFGSPAQPNPPAWTGVFRGVNGTSTGVYGLVAADFNGDRHDDVLAYPCNENFCGQELYEWRNGAFVLAWRRAVGAAFPLDVNADGLLDLVTDGKVVGGKQQAVVQLHLGDRPDLLTGIGLRGLGPYAEINYTGLANKRVHLPCADAAYPLTCVKEGGSIVAQHKIATYAADSAPQWDTYDHYYADARSDVRGRGWLGFGRHTVIRRLGHAIITTTFDNKTRDAVSKHYPYAHLPKTVGAVVPTGIGFAARRSTTTNENRIRRLGSGTFTVELRHITKLEAERPAGVNAWQVLRTTTTDTTYDEFGNQDLVVTATAGGRKTTVDSSFTNDTVSWLIGLRANTVTTGCDADGVCTARTSTFSYYPNGNPKTTVVEPNSSTLKLRTKIVYDTFGNPTTVTRTDSAGVTRTDATEYDSADRLYATATIDALGHRTRIETHPGLGVRTRLTDPNGVATTMRYDKFGRLRETNHADGSFERVTHSPLRTTVARADGAVTVTSVDQLGRERLRSVKGFDGKMSGVRTDYDAQGRVGRTSRPFLPGETKQYTTFTYDGLDRLKTTTAPDGVAVRRNYRGLETHTIDAKGVESYILDNANGQVATAFEDDPNSAAWLKTRFKYDGFGQTTKIRAPDDTVQTMRYDALGRRLELNDPSTGKSTTTYNAFGDVASETDATGATTTYVVDGLGRVKTATSPDGRVTNRWDTAKHGTGKLASSNSPDSVLIRYGYDEFGHQTTVSSKMDDGVFEVVTGYDGIGRPDRITYPQLFSAAGNERLRVKHTYNSSGYLSEVKDLAPTGPVYWTALDRDAASNITKERLGNGMVTDYTYVPATGLLDTITTTLPFSVEKLAALDYGYDVNRNVNLRNDKANERYELYTHDELNRLERWQVLPSTTGAPLLTSDYAYNTMGNLTTETTARAGVQPVTITNTYGDDGAPPHALTDRNGASYTYDAVGRQLTAPDRTVTYNTVDLPKTLAHGSKVTTFEYDAAGARAVKRDNDQTTVTVAGLFERRTPTTSDSREIHNLYNILVDGRVVAQVNRVQPNSGGPVAETRTSYLLADRQGSTTLTRRLDGQMVAYFYDPFGQRVNKAGYPLANRTNHGPRQGYTGHEHDDEYGLINMKGRIYDPEVRQFLSPDPVVSDPLLSQNHNRYSYVRNNPTTLTDPSGLEASASGYDPYAAMVSTVPETDPEEEELQQSLMQTGTCECVAEATENYDTDSGMYDTSVPPVDDSESGVITEEGQPKSIELIWPTFGDPSGPQAWLDNLGTLSPHAEQKYQEMKSGSFPRVRPNILNEATGQVVQGTVEMSAKMISEFQIINTVLALDNSSGSPLDALMVPRMSNLAVGPPRDALGRFKSGAGGESAATVAGKRAHSNYANTLGGGNYVFNRTLPGSGLRPDAIDYSQRVVRELKPDTRGAVSKGWRQVNGYKAYLEEITGQPWTADVDVYTP